MDYWTTTQAAQILKISPTRLAVLIREGRLRAEKAGNAWLILKSDLDEFIKQRPEGKNKGGRPRKPKRADS